MARFAGRDFAMATTSPSGAPSSFSSGGKGKTNHADLVSIFTLSLRSAPVLGRSNIRLVLRLEMAFKALRVPGLLRPRTGALQTDKRDFGLWTLDLGL